MSEIGTRYNDTSVKDGCKHCDSDKVRFVDFGQVTKRLNEKQIIVTEIWVCKNCGKEFERLGILYSPQNDNRTKLFIAFLIWAGYATGSMLGYAYFLAM